MGTSEPNTIKKLKTQLDKLEQEIKLVKQEDDQKE